MEVEQLNGSLELLDDPLHQLAQRPQQPCKLSELYET